MRASSFDVAADGQRFLVNQVASDSSDTPVTAIINWPESMKNRSYFWYRYGDL